MRLKDKSQHMQQPYEGAPDGLYVDMKKTTTQESEMSS